MAVTSHPPVLQVPQGCYISPPPPYCKYHVAVTFHPPVLQVPQGCYISPPILQVPCGCYISPTSTASTTRLLHLIPPYCKYHVAVTSHPPVLQVPQGCYISPPPPYCKYYVAVTFHPPVLQVPQGCYISPPILQVLCGCHILPSRESSASTMWSLHSPQEIACRCYVFAANQRSRHSNELTALSSHQQWLLSTEHHLLTTKTPLAHSQISVNQLSLMLPCNMYSRSVHTTTRLSHCHIACNQ